jgi:hypothetical protein
VPAGLEVTDGSQPFLVGHYDSAVAMAAAIREAIADHDSGELSDVAARTMTRFIALPIRVLRPDAETDSLTP